MRTGARHPPRSPSSPEHDRARTLVLLVHERDEADEPVDLLHPGNDLLPDDPGDLFGLGWIHALDLDQPSVHSSSSSLPADRSYALIQDRAPTSAGCSSMTGTAASC